MDARFHTCLLPHLQLPCEDRFLQKQLRILIICTEPLHKEFARHLKQQKAGRLDMLQWHAHRATGALVNETIRSTLEMMNSPDMPRWLGCHPGAVNIEDVAEEDLQVAEQLFSFVVEVAGNRAWSQRVFSDLLPYNVTLIFQEDQAARLAASTKLQKIAGAMVALDLLAKRLQENTKSPVHELVQELGL